MENNNSNGAAQGGAEVTLEDLVLERMGGANAANSNEGANNEGNQATDDPTNTAAAQQGAATSAPAEGGAQGTPPVSTENGASGTPAPAAATAEASTLDTVVKGISKPWEPNQEPPAGGADGAAGGSAQPNPDLDALKGKVENYEKILSSPFMKSVAAAISSGENPIEFLTKGMKTKNPSQLTDEQVFDEMLLSEGLSEDEIEIEKDKWSDLSPLDKRRKIRPFRDEMEAKRKSEFEEFANNTFSDVDLRNKNEAATFTAAANEYKEVVDKLKGQKFMGVMEITDDIHKGLSRALESGDVIPKRADGSIDAQELLKMVALYKYHGVMFDAIVKHASYETYNKLIEENTMPAGQVQPGGQGTGGAQKTLEELIIEDLTGLNSNQ